MTATAALLDTLVNARRRLAIRVCAQALIACFLGATPVAAPAATLEADVYESSDGSFQLRWEADEAVRLVESRTQDFAAARTLYAGADRARAISGKVDGQWYYRLEADAAPRVVGGPIAVTVRHHPLGRAFAFFALGAVVFVATLGLITFGSRSRDERR